MSTPKVSVIVPNYNHAAYLPQRVESIMLQGFKDFEVLLLDDASTDNSLEIIEGLLKKYPTIQFVANRENSGSPFAQWNKGAQLAKGQYLWIAESDDYCEANLLETLVNTLEQDSDIGISYVQSILVNESGEKLNSYAENLKFIYKSKDWEKPFIKEGTAVCREWLFKHNPIPNASGALFRKSAFLEVGGADPQMRLNGDWFLYAKILMQHKLAFSPRELNYFRVHGHTQRERARSTANVYEELIEINNFLRGGLPNADMEADAALNEIAAWWTGSLPYQVKTKENRARNRKLYLFFKTKRKRLALHIILTYMIIGSRFILNKLGLLKPIKRMRSKIFPGKYFNY